MMLLLNKQRLKVRFFPVLCRALQGIMWLLSVKIALPVTPTPQNYGSAYICSRIYVCTLYIAFIALNTINPDYSNTQGGTKKCHYKRSVTMRRS